MLLLLEKKREYSGFYQGLSGYYKAFMNYVAALMFTRKIL